MSDITKEQPRPSRGADLVLREIWRIKEALSTSYGHDVDRLFGEAREHQKLSGHPIVNLQADRRDTSA